MAFTYVLFCWLCLLQKAFSWYHVPLSPDISKSPAENLAYIDGITDVIKRDFLSPTYSASGSKQAILLDRLAPNLVRESMTKITGLNPSLNRRYITSKSFVDRPALNINVGGSIVKSVSELTSLNRRGIPPKGLVDRVAPFGGVGEGAVKISGELPVAGKTAVFGQIPVKGAVRFKGGVPAAGAVLIYGLCGS